MRKKSEFLFQKTPNLLQEDFSGLNAELITIKEKLRILQNKKIIYIDDMAGYGWADFFADLFGNNIRLRVAGNFESLDEVFKLIINDIRYSTTTNTIIFLDLRLFNEKGDIDVKELSGYKLLKRIKVFNPTIPVIIVSATNNKKNISYLLHSGASFVWNKEGIQNRLSDFDYRRSVNILLHNAFKSFDSYQNEAERFVFQFDFFLNILEKSAKYSGLKINFNNQQTASELVIDTNAFLDFDYIVPLNTYFLIELFIKENKKITLINDVYYELLKLSMWNNISVSARQLRRGANNIHPKIIWCAKYAIEYLNLKISEDKIDIKSKANNQAPIESGFYPYLNNVYADPKIVEYCNNATTPIMLIAKDNGLINQISNNNIQIVNFNDPNNLVWNSIFIKDYFTNIEW